MISPLATHELLVLEELPSTQTYLASKVKEGSSLGGVLAKFQSQGRGRFDRVWKSEPGASLSVSLAFHDYLVPHGVEPKFPPYLLGMAFGLAAAGAFHTQIRWPNDLTISGRKVGGILSEMIESPHGLVPVIGIGLNLGQTEFPEDLEEIATSLLLAQGQAPTPEEALFRILSRWEQIPEPKGWSDLDPIWRMFDDTPGKRYKLPEGEATALGVGTKGELICQVDGETRWIMAAEAIFGEA